MRWGQDPFWRDMVMTDGDTFFLRSDYATIHFERGPEGAVRRMIWTWPGGAHLSFDKDQILESKCACRAGESVARLHEQTRRPL